MFRRILAILVLSALPALALANPGGSHDASQGSHGRSQGSHGASQGSHGGPQGSHGASQGSHGGPQGPHGCVNPAGHVRGWCTQRTSGILPGALPNTGILPTISGIIQGITGNRITLEHAGRRYTIDSTKAFAHGRPRNLRRGGRITASGLWRDGIFIASQIH
ncbi:MAG: hypothetical protein ACYDHD_10160 [Vulcanimicrobiaceae bacterium]